MRNYGEIGRKAGETKSPAVQRGAASSSGESGSACAIVPGPAGAGDQQQPRQPRGMGAVGWRCPPGAAWQGQSDLKAPCILRSPAAVMVREAGRQAFCPGRLDGSTEHRRSGVVLSARDLQRGEREKPTCVNGGAFLQLPNEPKHDILCLPAEQEKELESLGSSSPNTYS